MDTKIKPDVHLYVYFVDGREFQSENRIVTGATIMEHAGISAEQGLVQILSDGTQRQVTPTEKVELTKDVQFKKAPRFKRG